MALFKYEARGIDGSVKKGKIKAKTSREIYGILKEKRLRVISVEEVPESIWNKDLDIGQSIKLKDFVIYLRQFSTLLKAGITVVDATDILSKQTESKVLAKILRNISEKLAEGTSLSATFEAYPKFFPELFINMVRSGEASGTLDDTLERLADYYEKQFRTRQKVISALSYPAVIGVVAILVVIFLLLTVVPQFVDMFDDMDAELPAITVFVMSASDWIQAYWWALFLLVGIFIFVFTIIKKTPGGRMALDTLALRTPLIGNLIQKSAIARFTSTLASLSASSVPILEAVEITEKVVGNQVICKVLKDGRMSLEQGNSLANPMLDHWAFPPLVSQMIVIGESTGSLDAMLEKVADFYEAEVETVSDQLKALIEPIMILVLAVVVGTIVLSIMVPMFEMFNNI